MAARDAVDLGAPRPSLIELLLPFALVLVAAWLLPALWNRRGSRSSRGLGAFLRRALFAVGAGYTVFLLSWGLLYARAPLADTLGLAVTTPTAVELEEVARALAGRLDRLLLQEAQESTRSVSVQLQADGTAHAAVRAWSQALIAEPALGWNDVPVLAAPVLSPALKASGISGIFSPFTQECHVAAGLTRADRGFVACHEIAHSQGWAREDEANYLAWRIASRAEDPELQISAYSMALLHVSRALAVADPLAYGRFASELSDRIVDLYAARADFWGAVRSRVATGVATRVNDTYLKSQGQVGVASYGRMVDLVVAEFRS